MLCFIASYSQRVSTFVNEIPGFKSETAFPEDRYEKMNWKQFSQLPEANSNVDPANPDLHLLNAALHFATNETREKYRKQPLKFSSALRNAGFTHSYFMVKQNFFSHTNPKPGPFQDMKGRIEQYGFIGETIAENCSKGYVKVDEPSTYWQLAQEVVSRFLTSPHHKDNLLDSRHTMDGQGAYFYSKPEGDYWYFTVSQEFGSPYQAE